MIDKESRSVESGGERETRVTQTAQGGLCIKIDLERSGELAELRWLVETAVREQ